MSLRAQASKQKSWISDGSNDGIDVRKLACVLVSCECKVSLETRVVMPHSHFHCFVSAYLMELEGMLH